jgi:hypothetical protein
MQRFFRELILGQQPHSVSHCPACGISSESLAPRVEGQAG